MCLPRSLLQAVLGGFGRGVGWESLGGPWREPQSAAVGRLSGVCVPVNYPRLPLTPLCPGPLCCAAILSLAGLFRASRGWVFFERARFGGSGCVRRRVLRGSQVGVCLWCRLSELPLRPDLWSFDWLDFAWTLEYRESACCQGLTLPALVLCLALFQVEDCGVVEPCSVQFCCRDLRVLAVASLGARLLVGRSRFLRLAAGTSECWPWLRWELVCL